MKKRFVLLFLCALFLTPAQAQKKYALLIGVDYEGRLALDYTRQDAIKLGQILESNFGYTTKVLTRKSETTKTAINIAFSDLKNLDASYDQVIVFFSGHGVRDENSNEVGYLLPNDVDVNKLFLTAIDMSIIQNLSRTLKAKQAMFILDCCYSGIIGSYASMTISGGDKTLRSRQILTAGRSGQKARMYEAKELSLYTFYLTRALSRGGSFLRADSDKDGELTAWDLQAYVQKKVSQETRDKQTPRMYNYTEDDGIFLFRAKNYQRPAIPIVDNREKTKDDLSASSVRDVPPKDMVLIPAGTFRMGSDSFPRTKSLYTASKSMRSTWINMKSRWQSMRSL
ncbi:caspase family protein [candidate division KSB1 bacterium]|nr:caspase family protein [candidate division KSB1 bacterium]